MAGSIMVSFTINYSEDTESSDEDRDGFLMQYTSDFMATIRGAYDTNISVDNAGAVSTLSGYRAL